MTDEFETPQEKAARDAEHEAARVAKLTDHQVLQQSGHGTYGPGIIGKALADRAAKIMKATGGGVLGPAILDSDYAKKLAGRRAPDPDAALEHAAALGTLPDADRRADGPIDPADLQDPRNPWTYVTLSGAKVLAQQAGVSHIPRIKRAELIAELQRANVEPPAVPGADDQDGEGDE